MKRTNIKRETDLQMLSDWIAPGSRVLDLGCGRGILLEHLWQTKEVRGLGIDVDFTKVKACVKRGVSVYHGDAERLLAEFPDRFFDWVICSRTLQELARPAHVIEESLRVASNLAVGFVNHGFWLNRLSVLLTGARVRNEVFPLDWSEGHPMNSISIRAFEEFCTRQDYQCFRSIYLSGDWRSPLRILPNLRAGYVLYHLTANE